MSAAAVVPMDNSWLETLAAWGAGAIGLGGAGALLRRRLSRDSTEMAKDKAESMFVAQLLQERERALQETREALAAASAALVLRSAADAAISRLQATNSFQQMEIDRLGEEMQAFKRRVVRLYPESRPFADTDYVAPELAPEPMPPPPVPPPVKPKKEPKS